MQKTAKEYQDRDELFWKRKELRDKRELKDFSEKQYSLYNSNLTIRKGRQE